MNTKSFLKRHNNLTSRVSTNIKKVIAELSANDIENYIGNLQPVVKDIPPTHIFNYDETNLSDDPGNKKVICKRGSKYVENICNHSKSAVSLMFSGSAAGTLLPVYVVYKAENMWSTWTENGPEGTRYNRTKSGWFDAICFEDWFESTFLPNVRNLDGPKVIIGDNLSSHISMYVLKLCEDYNVRLVCLPPNSTHLTQPLDVALFAPMKRLWRDILRRWKQSVSGSKFSTIPKDMFPTLLKELMASLAENQEENLKSGFSKCGIYPLNKQKLLDRLPENQNVDTSAVGEAFIKQLKQRRAEFLTKDGPKKRKKKLQVPAGKSVSLRDLEEVEENSKQYTSTGGTTAKKSRTSLKLKKQKIKRTLCYPKDFSSDEDDIEMVLESDGETETFSDIEEILLERSGQKASVPEERQRGEIKPEDFSVDNFVIVVYNRQKYPGKMLNISENGPTVECMEKKLKFWRWPEKQDCLTYDWEDVWMKIAPPKIASKRNQFHVPELENFLA